MRRDRQEAFSLLELLLVSALFSLFLLVSYSLLSSGIGVWQKTASSQDVSFQLAKVKAALREDLAQASAESCAVSQTPSVPADLNSGDIVWFLSAINPATGQLAKKDDGTPFWQRNIVYYLSVPRDHDQLFGFRCAKQNCPHKFLVRRVFDTTPATTPDSPESREERLMSRDEVRQRTGPPQGYDLNIAGPAAEREELVASALLAFEVKLGPEDLADEVEVRVSGFQTEDAGKKVKVGSEDLLQSPYARHDIVSIFPGN
jgi:type II secretory pathway component PulJ